MGAASWTSWTRSIQTEKYIEKSVSYERLKTNHQSQLSRFKFRIIKNNIHFNHVNVDVYDYFLRGRTR